MSLSELYDRYFTVMPATTPFLTGMAYALRYRVYCVEHAYEDPSAQVGEREMDSYDSRSVHALLIYKPTATVIGCVRLVLPEPGSDKITLPMRDLLSEPDRARLDQCDPARTGEISRYAVTKTFRRRPGEEEHPDVTFFNQPASEVRRLAPHLSIALMRAVCGLVVSRGITTVCAVMSPSLLRMLDSLGVTFERIGAPVQYHGLRQPCIADNEALLARLATRNPEYHELLDTAYRRSPSLGSGDLPHVRSPQ